MDLEEGKDYIITSKDYFDEEGESFVNLASALKRGYSCEHLEISPNSIDPDATLAVRYEIDSLETVHSKNAKLCSFGVMEMTSGEFKGKEFMFPLVDMNSEELRIHLFAYSILTHFYVDKVILNKLINDPNYREYMEFTLDHFYYDESNPYHYIIELLVKMDPRLEWLAYDGWPFNPHLLFDETEDWNSVEKKIYH